MTVFESPWFFRMVENQAARPADRLIAVFRIAEQWVSAPGMRDLLQQQYGSGQPPLLRDTHLRRFLAETATATRSTNPGALASQLIILLHGAIAEELRDPDTRALQRATQAALAVVNASCQPARQAQYRFFAAGAAVAAGVCAVSLALFQPWVQPEAAPMPQAIPLAAAQSAQPPGVSPETLNAVLALHHRLEAGTCPAPQQLAMNGQQIAGYQNIVHFQSGDTRNLNWADVHAFMEWYGKTLATECYMPPENGHTTVAWVARTSTAARRDY